MEKEKSTHEITFHRLVMVSLPVLTFLSSGIGCLVAYLVGVGSEKIDPWPFVPYISDAGDLKPQSSWFTLFFVLSCFFTFHIIVVRFRQVAAQEKCIRINKVCLCSGIIFVIGKVVVASFQLSSHKNIHNIGAFVYFVGVLVFIISQTCIHFQIYTPKLRDVMAEPALRKSALVFCIRVTCCCGLVLTTILFGVFFFTPSLKVHNRGGENVGQGAEWTMAALKCVYMLTFMYDFWGTNFESSMSFSSLQEENETNDLTEVVIMGRPQYNRFLSMPASFENGNEDASKLRAKQM